MFPRLLIAGFIAIALVGCNPVHPGVWDLPKVESHIKESMELSELKLEPAGTGAYTGTGKSADGESFKVSVTQDAAAQKLSWKYEGDRGTIGDQKYEFVK